MCHQTGFGVPPLTGFGAPPLTGFGVPPLTGFGVPHLTGFGVPHLTGFGVPPLTGFGVSQQVSRLLHLATPRENITILLSKQINKGFDEVDWLSILTQLTCTCVWSASGDRLMDYKC